MLTHEQRKTYQAKGYIRLPAAFDRAAAQSMEDFIWARLAELHGIRRDDPDTWSAAAPWIGLNRFKEDAVFQAVGSPAVCAAIDDLLGRGCWKKPRTWGGFLVKFPDPSHGDWTPSDTFWHVDFHFTHQPGTAFGVRLFSLLTEVVPCGGATLVVSGSHRLVERFVSAMTPAERSERFAVLRDRFNGSHPWLAALTETGADQAQRIQTAMKTAEIVDSVPVRVEELCGEAGDVVILHPWLLHSPSPNSSDRPRLQLAKDIFAEAANNRSERPAAASAEQGSVRPLTSASSLRRPGYFLEVFGCDSRS